MRSGLLALLLVWVCSLGLRAEKVATLPAPKSYVNDYAGVLSDATKTQTEAICREVHDKTKAQIFVVTIHTLGDESKEQFANDLFHKWKIGEKKTDRGLLLLFSIDDHKWRIEVGYGFEGILNDAKVGDIGREMVPALKQKDYDGAIVLGVQRVAKVVADDANVTLDTLTPSDPSGDTTSTPSSEVLPPVSPPKPWWQRVNWFACLVLFFLCLYFWHWIRRMGRRLASTRPRSGLGNTSSGSNYTRSGAGFISSNSGSNFSDSSSGSSFSDSGSSSSDSGSSSDSFSGGDGGDSGGGGAGGDW
ncbi:protein of unknown function DUF477 [Granulicella mallensis MP5ACTX8]|uniref:TPM domain-containing protein n=2 Tax=Granulicella mallensis TaxID=940614 RepID=G8NX46_GRAMM|nr:protein of unknown function DUF477 [Granulicella mallensis MP5ACTX8]